MNSPLPAAALVAALCLGSAAHSAPTSTESTGDELAQIRSQLQNLLQRVERLEAENNRLKERNVELGNELKKQSEQGNRLARDITAADQPTSTAANWAERVRLTGDVRYRHQHTDDESASATREEHLLRARLAVEARVHERVIAAVGVSTSSSPGNPRSANVQLDGEFSRKSLYLDLAYFDWNIAGGAHLIGGKMEMPFARPGQSLFWDSDINPEGLAVTWQAGPMFGSAWSYWIEENVQTGTSSMTATSTDTKMYGLQIGRHFDIASNDLVLAASYYDLAAARGRRPFFNGLANGNSLTVTGGLAYDFQVVGLMAEYHTRVGGVPLQVWSDFARNLDAEFHTAFAMGTLVGKASSPGTWESGLSYQIVQKDALFAQHIDSDLGSSSDTAGWVLRTGYAPLKNWLLSATYFKMINNREVGTAYDFDHLMLDFSAKF